MAKSFGKSLALQKFIKILEGQIRNYWQIQTAIIYSQRWWGTIPAANLPQTLAKYPGDSGMPFSSIDISPEQFLHNASNVQTLNLDNSIVNIITEFEVYLFDIVKRLIYLYPSLIADSEMPMEASEIGSAINSGEPREWFAHKITDKYLRNKTHLKMIQKIQKVIKYNIDPAYKSKIEDWNKWTYVRNAIIHSGREVSQDLQRTWPEKYPNIGVQIALTDKDFVSLHGLALQLAKVVDERIMTLYIKNADAVLLVREFFVKDGYDNNKDLSRRINLILNYRMNPTEVDKALGYQRRTNAKVDDWRFSHFNFQQ